MRVLLIASPVPTHFTPLVPLAWALRAADHEVLVMNQPDVTETVRRAGLNSHEVGDWFNAGELLYAAMPPGKRPIEVWGRMEQEHLSEYPAPWAAHAAQVLPIYLDFARDWRPDLIVSDPMDLNSLVVGGLLDIPVVQHRFGVDSVAEPLRAAGRIGLRELYRSYGLEDLPDPAVMLDPCPPRLQLEGLLEPRPIRYVPFNGNNVMPQWLRDSPREPDGARRVVVSLGSRTLELSGVPFVRGLLEAFDGLPDVRAYATVGANFRPQIGAVPDNVRMVDPVPLHMLLDGCDAAVHHGGTGTAMTVTTYGLPQLVLPQVADQFAVGDRIEALGAGVSVDDAERQNDPAALHKALAAVLQTPSCAAAAEGLRQEMRQMPTPAQVALDLEQLLRQPVAA